MEAILKAFEKMEKREERRKEALARIESSRKSTEKQSGDDKSANVKKEKHVSAYYVCV